ISGNLPVLQSLLRATLSTAHVRFIEVRDRGDNILVYVEHAADPAQASTKVEIFHASIQRENIALDGSDLASSNDMLPTAAPPSGD
ncbi:hybrid sensor histidine kinase/response regulator, partial [Pseudomonas sp. BAgro211]|nr:hybrid sensor histidine kinase/response regulator [Pseudomonas sp. BAgro211]